MKPQIASELQETNPLIVETVTLFNRMEEIREEVARLAYDLFERRGKQEGYDQEDWLRAEEELLRPVTVQMSETANQLHVSAMVDGFTEKELRVSVEPTRLFISGKKQDTLGSDAELTEQTGNRSLMFFHTLDLPFKVDTQKAKASLKDDMLLLTLPRAAEIETSENQLTD